MKVSVDIDCTPEEARRFFGLPDLTPVHDAFVARMQQALADGGNSEYFAEMMKNWAPMGENGLTMWRQMMDQVSLKK
ncbi:DUF6489 family protein [Allosphingosinicella vermicomposti]|uniref:DUF6489 family protein n=1 Tax=Allosphingosinicella vermicomposti TaxID=614671 RepID=UPI000D0FE63B|nr:DUF6489 family protein [Allosphingosinicella vermicomposti]